MAKRTKKTETPIAETAEPGAAVDNAAATRTQRPAAPIGPGDVVVRSKMGRDHEIATPLGVVTIKGANSADLAGGYGRTVLSRGQWEYIEHVYGKTAAWVNGVVFAADNDNDADARARELACLKSGCEALEAKEIVGGKRKMA